MIDPHLNTHEIDEYYDDVRSDIEPLLPNKVDRALEVGCGTGNTLQWLKERSGCTWVAGIELYPEAAAVARRQLDQFYEGSVEHMEIPVPEKSLDLILCLDVFEHLVDPWATVQRLVRLLRPGGAMIASIPNVRNRKVLLPLLLKGRWEYTAAGLLDRTHLRFFTRSSAVALLAQGGLCVDNIIETGLGKSRNSQLFNALLHPAIRSFFVRQYLLRGVRKGDELCPPA